MIHKRKWQSLALAGTLGAAALSMLLVAPVLAGEVITAVVTGGELAMSPPRVGGFEMRTVTGLAQSTEAVIEAFDVVDLTGTGGGWQVTVAATPFDGGIHALDRGSLSMSPPQVDAVDTPSAGPRIAPGPYIIDDGSVQIASAAADAGMGRYTFSESTLNLSLPIDVSADSYVSTVTVTVAVAP